MAANRRSPTPANYGPTIPDDEFAVDLDEEFAALFGMAIDTLENVAGANTVTADCIPELLAYSKKGFWIIPAAANTGPATLAIGALAAKNWKKQNGDAFVGGENVAGVPKLIYYTGSEFRDAFSAPSGAAAPIPAGYFHGLETAPNATDPNNDIDFGIGICRTKQDNANFVLTSPITKRTDAVWTAGSGNGGILQSGNLAGTITITTNTAVTGTGTAFLTDFSVGQVIYTNGGQARRITVVTSNTAMTVESAWTSGETGVTYKRGGKAKNTLYRMFGLVKDDGSCDVGFGALDTPNDLPAGYSKWRILWHFVTDASVNNRPYAQVGDLNHFTSTWTGGSVTGANGDFALVVMAPPLSVITTHVSWSAPGGADASWSASAAFKSNFSNAVLHTSSASGVNTGGGGGGNDGYEFYPLDSDSELTVTHSSNFGRTPTSIAALEGWRWPRHQF